MIKKIRVDQLKVGMFVHDFNCSWIDHPFLTNRVSISNDAQLEKIAGAGLRELYIDTDRGLDVEDAPTAEQVEAVIESELQDLARAPSRNRLRVTLSEEMAQAVQVKNRAYRIVRDAMRDVRLGRAVELDQVEPVVQEITESLLRNQGALIGLLRIKSKDDYTFLHSVTVCTLVVAFCRSAGLDDDTMHQAGLGGLLHDVGKALVPDEILNKPGRLTEEEFAIIKRHPKDGYDILLRSGSVGEIPLDITLHHHERMDGSGYTKKLPGERISTLTQMAALVDVYDALTSDRCYHKAISAAEALRKIFEWSKNEFNPQMVQAFMHCVGIYPVGTLVRLQSGRLGVVVEPHETDLLKPKVNVFFSTRSNTYIRPEQVDLSRPFGMGGGDKILSHESPEKWRVDPLKFMSLH
ncbi:HD-GYP domain-containing protein [Noviherbaspirillum denitrificans]|uniref:Phosphodiesterase n=1 Tax=Noviherbaspirillum denitrificans TaxID=1968433 RepID=A0A254TAB3_9BURK|nr:HD-GYP domain-containing protein [Noviherbaspirillum denitrificans]OWW19590.1 phosphodiesterase [Noviherbaspirillum denitrificans]